MTSHDGPDRWTFLVATRHEVPAFTGAHIDDLPDDLGPDDHREIIGVRRYTGSRLREVWEIEYDDDDAELPYFAALTFNDGGPALQMLRAASMADLLADGPARDVER